MLDEIAEMPVELQPKLLRVFAGAHLPQDRLRKSYPVDFV
jgi:transcriptional regulator with GAF, ATPase, and Fis domain